MSIVAATFVGCGEPLEPAIVSVVVMPTLSRFVSFGETEQLTAAAQDANGNEMPSKVFTWESSDENVVTVNPSGFVTALGIGRATVVATCEGIPGMATVTVGPLGFPFIEQPSDSGNCERRPAGSVCLGFEDGYTWLIYDSVEGWDGDHGDWYGQRIVSAIGFRAEYYHVLGTNLVFERSF